MLKFATEMIDYQVEDSFPKQLTTMLAEIFDDMFTGRFASTNDVLKSPYKKAMESLIFKRFGLNVVLDHRLHQYLPAAIIPFNSDVLLRSKKDKLKFNLQPNLLVKGMFTRGLTGHISNIERSREKMAKDLNNKKGWISLKTAKVGGYLSEMQHWLIIDFNWMYNKGLSPEEGCAVILHELGHAFTGLETHYKFVTTNTAISAVMEDLNQNKPDKAYYTYKRYFGISDLQEAQLSESSEVTDFYGPLAKRYISTMSSQFLNSKYDETNFENMADEFSSRFGMGQYLVTALHKLHLSSRSIATSRKQVYLNLFLNWVFVAIVLYYATAFCIILMGLTFIFFSGKHNHDMTYDIPKDRYGRIRNSIANQLKDGTLTKEQQESLVTQYELIDSIMNDTYAWKSILDTIALYVKPEAIRAVWGIEGQQAAETALNNVLFVKSAKLNVI